jgi:pimeloyl-ACP methyl ester carboxylesterase
VVILLPGHSYHVGASGTYGLMDSTVDGGLIHALVARGVAVLSWDPTGMGMRQHKDGAPLFYKRFPTASRLGAMVGEVHAALDFIHCASLKAGADCADGEAHTGTYPALKLPPLDPGRVFLLGYSLGSLVALHAAALAPSDRPVSGVAAFSGWTPWRTGGGGAATGGLRLLYETLALIPRLGLFESAPRSTPYDLDELIGALAPRHLLLYTPRLNRFANASDVARAVRTANASWVAKGAASHFEVVAPETAPSDMRAQEIRAALDWVERVALRTWRST